MGYAQYAADRDGHSITGEGRQRVRPAKLGTYKIINGQTSVRRLILGPTLTFNLKKRRQVKSRNDEGRRRGGAPLTTDMTTPEPAGPSISKHAQMSSAPLRREDGESKFTR